MNKSIAFWAAPLLSLAICLFATSDASAARPYGWYYSGYAPVMAPAYGYGFGVVATPYGYTYNPRRAYRQAVRYGYLPPVVAVPAPVYAYPTYYAPYYAPRPYAPTRGPRDYLYQPGYRQQTPRIAPAPTPAMRNTQPLPPELRPELIPSPMSE